MARGNKPSHKRACPLSYHCCRAAIGLMMPFFMAGCATANADRAPLRMTITIDDVPVHGPVPAGQSSGQISDQLIATLAQNEVPAVIFVNGIWTQTEPRTKDILERWDEAGFQLANHGWSHQHLSEISRAEFEAELLRNDELLAHYGGSWRWFRYPFLDEGDTPDKRIAARKLLAQHGYRVAAVTMDFGDWAWTAPYARCLSASDKAAIAKLETAYLQAAREGIEYSRTLSHDVFNRDIPYVLLLHGGAMTAHMLPQLIELYRTARFQFVTLEEAQSDAAYREDVDPDLPARGQGLEGRAREKSVPLPPRASYSKMLESVCV